MSKGKVNTQDLVKIEKNPLSQALGSYFRKERDLLRKTSNELAKDIDIGASFYRMIEAGSANLHPSRVLKVIYAFPNSGIELNALCKYLVAVQMVETNLSSLRDLKNAIEDLSDADGEFEKLFRAFDSIFELMENNQFEKISHAIESDQIIEEVREFLTNKYYDFEPEMRFSQRLNKLIDETPSFYLDFALNTLQNLQELPTDIIPQELWNWERKNKNNLKSIFIVVNEYKSVTGEKNLQRYSYDYLWESTFKDLYILFVNPGTDVWQKEIIFEEFTQNLQAALLVKQKQNQLDNLENILNKVQFHVVEIQNEIVSKLLHSWDHKIQYDALWVYQMQSGINIGFATHIQVEEELIKPGKNLSYQETTGAIESLKDFWNVHNK